MWRTNPQASQVLRNSLLALEPQPTVVIVGMLADKELSEFCASLDDLAGHWLSCPTGSGRGAGAEELAEQLRPHVSAAVTAVNSVPQAMQAARKLLPEGGRILVCGSFQVVGPALEQLGLY